VRAAPPSWGRHPKTFTGADKGQCPSRRHVCTSKAGPGGRQLYFVWVPSHATRLAEFVGIGRGVDLNIYIWIVISLLLPLNLHLKLREHMELITVLARELAIANARSHRSTS
jgi:uncharacterized protein DUF2304